MAEFINEKYTDEGEVLAPDGGKDFSGIGKTEEYQEYKIFLEDGIEITCADIHIFVVDDKNIYCKDLEIGDYLETLLGKRKVVDVQIKSDCSNMYDLINVEDGIYYTNDVVSHNSSFCAAYILWFSCFNSGKTSGLVSNQQSSAIEILDRMKYMYANLPIGLKPGVHNYARMMVTFDNDSRVICSSTSRNSFRGGTINGVCLCDEFCHVPRNLQQDFWASNWPVITSSERAKMILISTPLGMYDLFYNIGKNSENADNDFKRVDVHGSEHPERDKKGLEEQKNILGDVLFHQEILTEFLGSSNTIIDSEVLKNLLDSTTPPITTDLNGALRIYEKPQKGCNYISGVDTSKGTGEHYSTIQTFRIDSVNPVKIEQVAVFEDNKTDPYRFSEIVFRVSNYYNNAYIMCENNAEGSTVVSQLGWEMETEQLVNTGSKVVDLGIRATRNTKPKAVNLMKKFLEDGLLKLNDKRTVEQLSDFTDLGNNRYKCVNLNDDLVSALYGGTYIFEMDILDEDVSFKKEEKEDEDVGGILTGSGNASEEDGSWLTQ